MSLQLTSYEFSLLIIIIITEILKAEETVKMEERKILRDKKVDDAQKQWTEIIPKWDHL